MRKTVKVKVGPKLKAKSLRATPAPVGAEDPEGEEEESESDSEEEEEFEVGEEVSGGGATTATPMAWPAPLSLGGGRRASAGAEALGHTVTEGEPADACVICLERPRRLAFGCGHMACQACGSKLRLCHICRAPITRVLTLFA